MNFRQGAQSRESPLRLTPQFGQHKSQTPVSCSVVYKKTPGPFKMGREREKNLCLQKTERRHYELAMSDELFKDTNRPGATWFIDCSKGANSFFSPLFTVCHLKKKPTRRDVQTLGRHLLIYDLLGSAECCRKRKGYCWRRNGGRS